MLSVYAPFSFYQTYHNTQSVRQTKPSVDEMNQQYQIGIADDDVLVGKTSVEVFVDVKDVLRSREFRCVVVDVVDENRRFRAALRLGVLHFCRHDGQIEVVRVQQFAIDDGRQAHLSAVFIHHECVEPIYQS